MPTRRKRLSLHGTAERVKGRGYATLILRINSYTANRTISRARYLLGQLGAVLVSTVLEDCLVETYKVNLNGSTPAELERRCRPYRVEVYYGAGRVQGGPVNRDTQHVPPPKGAKFSPTLSRERLYKANRKGMEGELYMVLQGLRRNGMDRLAEGDYSAKTIAECKVNDQKPTPRESRRDYLMAERIYNARVILALQSHEWDDNEEADKAEAYIAQLKQQNLAYKAEYEAMFVKEKRTKTVDGVKVTFEVPVFQDTFRRPMTQGKGFTKRADLQSKGEVAQREMKDHDDNRIAWIKAGLTERQCEEFAAEMSTM